MKSIPLMLRISRLFVALSFIVGPMGPVYAGLPGIPSSSNYKEGATAQPVSAKNTVLPAGQLKLPSYFEANRGQTDASVKFFTRAAGYKLFLTASEAVMVMPTADAKSRETGVLRMKLKGANAAPLIQGQDILPGRSSYFIGKDASKWQTGVRHYSKVKLSQVYPGIDMVYRYDKGNVEYDFVVAAGAKPWRILMGFEGAKGLRLDPQGNLVLRLADGEMTYKAPDLYQMLGAKKVSVKGRFVMAANNNVRFEVGNYVQSKELVIDPGLSYSSFLGGAEEDKAYAIAVDDLGNAYVTGTTTSAAFPTAGTGAGGLSTTNPAAKAGSVVFVTKVNPDGTERLWSVFIGNTATSNAVGRGIAVDGATHKIFIVGDTTDSAGFPSKTTLGTIGGSTFDAFWAGISDGGTETATLNFLTLFGGPGDDFGNGIAIDGNDNVYVTGTTTSLNETTFPITATVAQGVAGAGAASQAYILKFYAAGGQAYGTYLGGGGAAFGNAIAVDAGKNAYVTGKTEDAFLNTVTWANAFKKTISGSYDAFIAKLDPTGATYLYQTYVGGSGIDIGTGIAVDGESPANIYITGMTYSDDFPGPGVAAYDALRMAGAQTTQMSGDPNAFVFKLSPDKFGPNDGMYSTYFGRSGITEATAIAVDGAGQAYITGINTGGDIPVVGEGALPAQANQNGFLMQLNNTGGVINFMSYIGGTTLDYAQGVALDSVRNMYVTGYTSSNEATFPLVADGFQHVRGGGTYDGFVMRFGAAVAPVAGAGAGPGAAACGDDYFFPSPATGAIGTFAYCMNGAGTVKIRVYNAIGDIVAKLEDERAAGAQTSQLNTARLAPGVYLYRVEKKYGGSDSIVSKVKKFAVQH